MLAVSDYRSFQSCAENEFPGAVPKVSICAGGVCTVP